MCSAIALVRALVMTFSCYGALQIVCVLLLFMHLSAPIIMHRGTAALC